MRLKGKILSRPRGLFPTQHLANAGLLPRLGCRPEETDTACVRKGRTDQREVKATAFKPERAGKINFYLSAVDDLLKHQDDQPSIGLLLCRSRNRLQVEYALRDIQKPIGKQRTARANTALATPMFTNYQFVNMPLSHKHLKLDQAKIDKARRLLGLATEQETIDRALDLIIAEEPILRAHRKVKGSGGGVDILGDQ